MKNSLTSRLWKPFACKIKDDFIVLPNRTVNYQLAYAGIQGWLSAFDAADLQPGDRIIISTDRCDVVGIGFIASILDGIIPVVVDGKCPVARLRSVIKSSEPKLVFSEREGLDFGSEVGCEVLLPENPRGFANFWRKNDGSCLGLKKCTSERTPRLPDDNGIAYLMFTSGTTSDPTGVAITRKNLSSNLTTLTKIFNYNGSSRIFNDMILAHADGMIQGPVLAAWNVGAVLRAGGFELGRIEEWLAYVRQLRATHVITVPTIWAMIQRYARYDDYFDAPECKWLQSVADKITEREMLSIERRFSRPLVSHYGLTETVASALYAGSHPLAGPAGTLGYPIDCEARIFTESEDAQGELQLRGKNIFAHYWRNESRTAESFTKDGWFRTGDLVKLNCDGSYQMLGRLKSVIMSGGLLIHPSEIDEILLQHPYVLESVTLAIPDEIFGEIPVSAITSSRDVSEDEILKYLASSVEYRKLPRHVVTMRDIPRGPSGKPSLLELRGRLVAELQVEVHETADTGKCVQNVVFEIASEIFHVPIHKLSKNTNPNDLVGWDSFTHINLILHTEASFKIKLSTAKVSSIQTLGDLVTAVQEKA